MSADVANDEGAEGGEAETALAVLGCLALCKDARRA